MTFSIAQVVAILILACSSFGAGWLLRRIQAKTREAQLHKSLQETRDIIPQLETNVRKRDQRLAVLSAELVDWKDKVPQLETSVKRQAGEVHAKERELRLVRTELSAVKDALAEAPRLAEAERAPLREALKTWQARCDELVSVLAAVEAHPPRLDQPGDGSDDRAALAAQAARSDAMGAALRDREATINELRTHLDSVVARRDAMEIEASERANEVMKLRDDVGKWQARVPKLLATIKARESTIEAHATTLADRNQQVKDRDGALAQREILGAKRELVLAEQAVKLVEAEQAIEVLRGELAIQRVAEQKLHDELQVASQRFAIENTRVAELSAKVDALVTTVAERDATNAERHTALQERDAALEGQRQASEHQTAEFQASLAHTNSQLATALRVGRDEQASHRDMVESLVAERDAVAARVRSVEQELDQLRAQQSQALAAEQLRAEHEFGQRTELSAARDQLTERLNSLQAQLAMGERQRAVVEAERSALAERASAFQEQLTQQQNEREALQRSHDATRGELAELHTKLAEAEAAQHAVQSGAANMDAQIVELQEQRTARESDLTTVRASLDQSHAQSSELQSALQQRDAEMVVLRAELATGPARVAPLERMLKARDAAIVERSERIDTLTSQIETLDATLRQRASRISELEKQVTDAAAVEGDGDVRKTEYLEQRVAAQIEKNREQSRLLDERDREVAALTKQRDLNDKSLTVLKQQLDGARDSEARLAELLRTLKSEALAGAATEPSESAAIAPNGLLQARPEAVDDLQQIRGIGEGFERGLNKLGIYRYSQLAGLSAAEIVWIENQLPTFRGRIERDDWPTQAAQLLAQDGGNDWTLRAPDAPTVHGLN